MTTAPPAKLPACVAEQVSLAPKTTLGVGGNARLYAAPQTAQELHDVLRWARDTGVGVVPLGSGSNVVVADAGVDALVLRLPPARPVTWTPAGVETVEAWVDGAADWDTLARASVDAGLLGLECTVGIPGTMAAAVLQNVGAYGQQLGDVLVAVAVCQLADGRHEVVAAADCGLGYRRSHFKGAWRGAYLVQAVQLRLRRGPRVAAWPAHAGLRQALGDPQGQGALPEASVVAGTVLRLRREKSMLRNALDPNARSAGSFFVNPEVGEAVALQLQRAHPSLPCWPVRGEAQPAASGGLRKLAAAWLIEHAGLRRGHRFVEAGGRVGLSAHHALALVNVGGASAADVLAATRTVRRRVSERFGITLEPEPQFVGFATPTPFA